MVKRAIAIAVVLFLALPLSVFGTTSGPIALSEAYYWKDVHESGDVLIVSRYNISADGVTEDEDNTCAAAQDWDFCSPRDVIVQLQNDNEVVREASLGRLGPGIMAFYIPTSSAAAITSFSRFEIEYIPSPFIFSDLNTRRSVTPTFNTNDLSSEIRKMLETIESDFPLREGEDNPYSFAEGQLVSNDVIVNYGTRRPTGWDMLTSANRVLPRLIAQAFQISSEQLDDVLGKNWHTYLLQDYTAGQRTVSVADMTGLEEGTTIRFGKVHTSGSSLRDSATILRIDSALSQIVLSEALPDNYLVSEKAFIIRSVIIDVPEFIPLPEETYGLGKDLFGVAVWVAIGIGLSVYCYNKFQTRFAFIALPFAILIGHEFGHVPTNWIVAIGAVIIFAIAILVARSLTKV